MAIISFLSLIHATTYTYTDLAHLPTKKQKDNSVKRKRERNYLIQIFSPYVVRPFRFFSIIIISQTDCRSPDCRA